MYIIRATYPWRRTE